MPPFSQILLDPRHPLHVPVLLTLGILLVALPAWFCPLIPFVDLISFAAIHSYPAVQSYGPDHYYTFQFTYILPHILSRAMTGFGVSLAAQVWLLHTAEVAGVFTAILLLLRDYVRSPLVYLPGAVLGAVAFIDGMHVWGGPLAFTATAIPFGITLWYLMRSLRTGAAPPNWPLIAAAFLGMLSHPYIGPCLAGLYILYLLLGGRGRLPLLLLTAFLAAYLLLISRDSPEAPDAAAYRGIFGFSHVLTNLKNFFVWNTVAARALAGADGPLLTLLFHLVEAVKFAGLLGLPLLWPEIRVRRDLLLLAVTSLAAWITFLLAGQPDFMSQWPQRILVLGAVPMFVLGVLVLDRLAARSSRFATAAANPRLPLAVAATLALLLAFAQRPLFTLAPAVVDLFERTRSTILASGARDALIDAPLYGDLRPTVFYAIPYMLFSDREIVARKLAVYTNWHTWPRHNTRIREMQRPSGQPRYQLLFDAPDPARPRFYQARFIRQTPAAPAPASR